MPNAMIKSFAEKTGKSVEAVEEKWSAAKEAVKKQYPDVKEDSDKFYPLVVSILKKMVGMKNEDAEPQGDTNTVTMGGEDAIYKKRMSGKKKVWDRMDSAIKEKKLKEGTIWEKLSIKLDELEEVTVKEFKPGEAIIIKKPGDYNHNRGLVVIEKGKGCYRLKNSRGDTFEYEQKFVISPKDA